MNFTEILLEDWMRRYYFAVDADIGSSGVENFSLAELRPILGFTERDLDRIVLRDSQSLGGAEVRQALAARWLDGETERVLVTHGSSEAIYLAMSTFLAAGDEVVLLDPGYPQYDSLAAAIGCRIKRWRLRFEAGYAPDMAEAARLITPGTRMVIVNFPHNPTGATLAPGEQHELIRLVEQAGAYLLWDGAFTELAYGRPPLPEPARRSDRVLSVGTLSKAYGLPGLRVGWCLAAPELLGRMLRLRDHMTLHLSPLVEFFAARTIEHGAEIVAGRREQARQNLAFLAAWIAGARAEIEWVPPAGGACAFIRFRRLRRVDEFCHRLACEHRVLLIPGSCFNHPAHARLGFGDSPAGLRLGLARLSRLMEQSLRATPPVPAALEGPEILEAPNVSVVNDPH